MSPVKAVWPGPIPRFVGNPHPIVVGIEDVELAIVKPARAAERVRVSHSGSQSGLAEESLRVHFCLGVEPFYDLPRCSTILRGIHRG